MSFTIEGRPTVIQFFFVFATFSDCALSFRLVSKRDLPTLEAWKLAGADFNVSDYDKRTPLHIVSAKSTSGPLLSPARSLDRFTQICTDKVV